MYQFEPKDGKGPVPPKVRGTPRYLSPFQMLEILTQRKVAVYLGFKSTGSAQLFRNQKYDEGQPTAEDVKQAWFAYLYATFRVNLSNLGTRVFKN